jgi:hypothetical protein
MVALAWLVCADEPGEAMSRPHLVPQPNHKPEDAHAIVCGTAFRCRNQGAILPGRCSEYDAMRIIFPSVAGIFAFPSYVMGVV